MDDLGVILSALAGVLFISVGVAVYATYVGRDDDEEDR